MNTKQAPLLEVSLHSETETSRDPVAIVERYYRSVDAAQVKEALDSYAEECVYVRCGECFSGKTEINKFFTTDRKLRGKHEIVALHELHNGVVAEGIFEGINRYGDAIKVPFADFFFFNEHGKINRRHTYLMAGRALIH